MTEIRSHVKHSYSRDTAHTTLGTASGNTSNVSLSSLWNDSSAGDSRTFQPICRYFTAGRCKHGDKCKFIHEANQSALSPSTVSSTSSPESHRLNLPAPVPNDIFIVNVPDGCRVYSIHVEYVATGIQHNARSIAQVALVDEWSCPVINVLIAQEKPVVSYLTHFTGLTQANVENYGIPLADAMAILRAHIPPNAVLIGHNIQSDIRHLQLAEGVDYHSLIDISLLFRIWDSNRGNYVRFSQDHCAAVWLGMSPRSVRDAVTDAAISMALFHSYRSNQSDINRIRHMQSLTWSAPRIPGFSSLFPVVDGCCMGNRNKCFCSAPFL